MNKNKLWVKTLSGTLCVAILMSNITPTFAATTKEQAITTNDTRETEVLYNKSASYFVTIPKIITLDGNKSSKYSVKVEGDITSDKNVFVTPVDAISETTDTIDFYMHDKSTKHPKGDVTATVIQNKDNWNFEEASKGYEETNNTISAPNLSAGEWSGTFNFNINLKYAHNHSYTSEVIKAPTCTEKGIKTFTCVDGDDSYTEEIPALGHDYSSEYTIDKKATHTEAGSKSQHCSRCDAKQNVTEIPATGHKYNDGVVTKAPTCTEKGIKTFTCVDGDNSYTEEIPAKGHKYGEVTYTWSSDKSICTAKRVCANDASHVETETVNATSTITKDATCTTTGTKTYTATFKNGAFAKQTSTSTIPALGHDFNTDYTIDKNPTHTEDGSKSQHCKRCGAKQNIITISATGHTYNAGVITKTPTCTEKGLKTYTCIGGDHSYTEEIPATGHKYGTPTYTWSSDKSTCTAKRVCANDASHIETETVNTTNAITKEATCTTTGTRTYTATFKNGAFAKQTSTTTIPATGHKYNDGVVTKVPTCTEKGIKTFTCVDGDNSYTEEIPATGHNYGTPTYTWSSDKSTCTAERVCANDASHIETETVNTTNAITKEATCTTTGTMTYTATFKNSAFAKSTSTKRLPIIHNYVNNICTKCGSVNIVLGQTYSFGGYEWDVAQKDDSTHTAVLQSRGVTSGYWPGYKMAKFGNGSSYTSSIVNKDISEYDTKTQSLYASIKSAEATNGKGLYLTDSSLASVVNMTSTPKSYNNAFKAAATNYLTFGATNPYAWTGTYGTTKSSSSSSSNACAYWINSNGTKSLSKITNKKGSTMITMYSQGLNAVIAPAFDLDLTKVTLNGSQLNIK